MAPTKDAQQEKEEIYRICLNNLLVVMNKLDPIEDMIDEACAIPGTAALHALNKKLYALNCLIEAEVSNLDPHSTSPHMQR